MTAREVGPAAVEVAVSRAREASGWWAERGYAGRREALDRWRAVLRHRMAELAGLVRAETGKPAGDAQLEVALTLEHLAWAAAHARSVLGRARVRPGLLGGHLAASVERVPFGVVGVIGPWNYPVFTPMGSIVHALAAGNAVVFKPSELTPGVGRWLARSLAEAVGRDDLLQVVTGGGETGAALCRSGVDKVAFTGSTATAKRVMATCAERLTPVLIECGGKDALLVDADADVDAAADAGAWGAFANAGQTCAGVERAYVHEQVYDAFLAALAGRARSLRAGTDEASDYGPMTMPGQADVVRAHVEDALGRGGRAVTGGPVPADARAISATVLVDVPEDSVAVTDETFGPTVTVRRVAGMDEAVTLANASRYGLGAAVFSAAHGDEIAGRLRCGMVSVNSVIAFVGVPGLPFGGVGDSGFGRIHGEDGLREFTFARAVARQRRRPLLDLTTFDRTRRTDRVLGTLMKVRHGRRP